MPPASPPEERRGFALREKGRSENPPLHTFAGHVTTTGARQRSLILLVFVERPHRLTNTLFGVHVARGIRGICGPVVLTGQRRTHTREGGLDLLTEKADDKNGPDGDRLSFDDGPRVRLRTPLTS